MNSLGRIFRIHVFGESHGELVGVNVDGCPAGIPLTIEDFLPALKRRQAGAPGTTPRVEQDLPILSSGVFNSKTTGAPLTIIFKNENKKSNDYNHLKITPRPGHADFVAMQKFGGYNDHRGGGHFSGRLTLALVAAGVVAKKILGDKININATLTSVNNNPNIDQAIEHAIAIQDSVGGIVNCNITGLPARLGEPFFDSLESIISHAVFSIPAIKGIEFGSGFKSTTMLGSQHNDSILDKEGHTKTNFAGGINGGISNGNELYFNVAIKPTSSTPKQQSTFNLNTNKEEVLEVKGRHDLCIALRVPVIIESVSAIVIADFLLLEQQRKRVF